MKSEKVLNNGRVVSRGFSHARNLTWAGRPALPQLIRTMLSRCGSMSVAEMRAEAERLGIRVTYNAVRLACLRRPDEFFFGRTTCQQIFFMYIGG